MGFTFTFYLSIVLHRHIDIPVESVQRRPAVTTCIKLYQQFRPELDIGPSLKPNPTKLMYGGPQVSAFVQRPGTRHRHYNHTVSVGHYTYGAQLKIIFLSLYTTRDVRTLRTSWTRCRENPVPGQVKFEMRWGKFFPCRRVQTGAYSQTLCESNSVIIIIIIIIIKRRLISRRNMPGTLQGRVTQINTRKRYNML